MNTKHQNTLKYSTILTFLILLIPLVAMQFTSEVNWSFFDFLIGGVLLFSFFSVIIWVYSKLATSKYKWPIIFVFVLLFVLMWTELAVGVFGTPFAGN